MPSKFQEIIVAAILPAVEAVGKAQLLEILKKIKTNNTPEVYSHTLKSVYSAFSLMKDLTTKTKTKLDDGVVNMVLEAVEEAAEDGNIEL